MKYPEYRLSMEAALPSSVQSWFGHELELLGIDSIIYTRYIISLLQQDSAEVDLESSEADVHFLEKKFEIKQQRSRKSEKKKVSISEEDKKKHAAIQCLVSVADETSGIENLVEELCSRLKDCQQVLCSPMVPYLDQSQQSSVCSSDTSSSEDSGSELQDPAERYYAAFPALHAQDKSTESSLAIPKDTIWKKNPLLKPAVLGTTEGVEENQTKQNLHCISSSDLGKKSKDKKDHESNKGSKLEDKFTSTPNHKSKSSGQSSKQEVDDLVKSRRFRSWPVSYAENDVRHSEKSKKKITRSNEELCTRVECLLKGMLLPVPDKRYKELEDVDEEQSSKVQVRKSHESGMSADKQRANSISPELQENTDWYTEPMEIFSQPVGNTCKQPLYKRNSSLSLSPCGEDLKFQSDKSSPVLFDCETYVDHEDEEGILIDGNLLIPAWLTSELEMPLQHEDALRPIEELVEKLETDEPRVVTPGWNTIKVDPNLWQLPTSDLIEKENEAGLEVPRFTMSSRKPSEEDVFFIPTPTGSIETIMEGKPSLTSKLRLKSDSPSPTTSLSLVDWQYLSRFLDVQGFSVYDACFDSGLWSCTEDYPVEPGPVPCWQSKILFNEFLHSFHSDEEANIWGWSWDQRIQQLGDWENFSQLWNVNNQMKTKTSPWSSSLQPILGLWFESNLAKEIQQMNSELGKNTLIPKISVELDLDEKLDDKVFERENAKVLFERSTSLGNVSFWDTDEQSQFIPNPKLSQSFELVPSEHSAFDDVPRKLPHVHSEPNLVLYRQVFADTQIDTGEKQTKSPQEHLYFSPKTHFRPITPAYAPELSTVQPKEPAHLSHDLFGGYFASKTPYQQYHCSGDGVEEDGDGFVPKFKLKNSSKYIQTGDSLENNDTANTLCEDTESSESDCKTPEAITLATVEEQLLDKDIAEDIMGTIEKEKDSANIDSAYETDYGISILDQEQSFEEKNEKFWDENVSDSKQELNYAATNLQCVCQENEVSDRKGSLNENAEEESNGGCQAGLHWSVQEIWGSDYDPQHFGFDGQMDEKYHNIWSNGQDSLIPDISCLNLQEEQREPCLPFGEYPMLENMDYPFGSGVHLHDEHLDSGVHLHDEHLDMGQVEFSEEIPTCEEECTVTQLTVWTESKFLDTGQLLKTFNPNSDGSFNDYVSVKLVYKDKQSSQDAGDKSYGDCALVPMPGEALYSSELEREWLNPDDQSRHLKKSRFQRKPCSYYLEGICRRSDCKFAHDIANITCRFWEDGECFKGPLCPFLHGYPSDSGPVSEEGDKEKFELCQEEFPEIQKSHAEKSAVLGKKLRPGRSLNSSSSARKVGCRKQYRWKSSSRQLKSESKT